MTQRCLLPIGCHHWRVRRYLLKLSHAGDGFLTTLLLGGKVVERRVDDPTQSWAGRWYRQGSRLTIDVGNFSLAIPAATGDGPWWGSETSVSAPGSVEFTVARTGLVDARAGQRWGLAKVFGDRRIHLAELASDGGLKEYPLQQGALEDPWTGKWDITSKGLEISVGAYSWCGHPDPTFPGLYRGVEKGPHGGLEFNCVTYRLRDAEATNGFQAVLNSDEARAAAELLGSALKGLLA